MPARNIIKNIFNKKIIAKINYEKIYENIINNNFNISKNNEKEILKLFEKIKI